MTVRCAIYTRKSTEEGLEQDFNSLDAQREACEAYIQSQRSLGWKAAPKHYDDGGVSGGTLERPALKDLLVDIEAGRIDLVVVYKVDRLTRSLTDFSKIIEIFDGADVSFVSVTQQFNTANSMGRLTLNMLLSFAQFEREVTAERIRDKIAASKRKGMWMGGLPPLGYDVRDKKLVVNRAEARTVRQLFDLYLKLQSVRKLKEEADNLGLVTKRRISGGKAIGGKPFTRGHLYCLLHNPLYVGQIMHKGETYEGQHEGIVDRKVWNKVQQHLLDRAPKRRSNTNTRHACLLGGLVYDEAGDRLCPTYAKNGNSVHAYYVSKRLTHGPDKASQTKGDGWRLPAGEFEVAIVNALATFLAKEVNWIGNVEASEMSSHAYTQIRKRIEKVTSALRSGDQDDVRSALTDAVARIAVAPGKLTVLLKTEVLGLSGEDVEIAMPFHTKRRGVESRIVLGNDATRTVNRDAKLINAVERSFRWWRLLTQKDGWSVQKLAKRDNVDASDVTRFLPLVFLAPKIIEAILDGRQPVDLTLERVKKIGPLPTCWEEQAAVLGFAELS